MSKRTGSVRGIALALTVAGLLLTAPSVRGDGTPAPTIDRVAGTGTIESGGDGGPAELAGVPGPFGLAFDSSGNAYITHRGGLRRVDAATGIISTIESARAIAITPVLSDGGGFPHHFCLDSAGCLYFVGKADWHDSLARVWKFDPSTGAVTTIASLTVGGGGPHPTITSTPMITMDPQGNLTVSCAETSTVYRITIPAGAVSAIAGTGTGGFSGDGGPATAARLSSPRGVAYDVEGNLYVVDSGNDRIRRVEAGTGTITTRYSWQWLDGGAGSLAIAPNGDMFVHAIGGLMHFYAATGEMDGFGDGSTFDAYTSRAGDGDIVFDPSGNLGVATNTQVLLILNTSTMPQDIIFSTLAGVRHYTGDGGPALQAGLGPMDVAVDSSGNIYVSENPPPLDGIGPPSSRIRRIDAVSGVITTLVAESSQFGQVSGMALGATGGLIVSSASEARVCRVDIATGTVSTIAGNGTATDSGDGGPSTEAGITPSGIAVDQNGNIFVACAPARRIRRIDAATGMITTYAGTGSVTFSGDGGPAVNAGVPNPGSLAFDSTGNLFLADMSAEGGGRIRRVDAVTGVITTVAGTGYWGSVEGRLATQTGMYPVAVAVDASGNIFVVDGIASRIRRIDAATGLIATLAGAGNGPYGYPDGDGGPAYSATLVFKSRSGMAFDQNGDLLLASSTLRRIHNPNGTWVLIQAPTALVLQPDSGGAGTDASFAINLVGLPSTGSTLVVKNLTSNQTLLTATASSGYFYPSGRFSLGASTVEARVLDVGGATLAVTTFTAQVHDTVAPSISGCEPKTLNTPSTPAPVSLAILGVSVSDAVDPAPTASLSVTELQAGTTNVTVTAIDASGNTSACSFDVTVAVTPVATLETSTPSGYPRSIELTFTGLQTGGVTTVSTTDYGPDLPGNYQFGGDYVWYDLATTATSTGQITLSFSWTEGEFADEGSIRLLHFENNAWKDVTTSVDTEGNKVYGTVSSLSPFAVAQVLDAAPPVIAAHADVHADATSTLGAVVTYTAPTATDDFDGAVPVACAPASGSLFEVGVTTITCTSSDSHSNTATRTFDVIVRIDPNYLKGAVADQLNALIPTSDKATVKKLLKAIKEIQDSLATDLWTDDFHLSEKGRKVFKEESEAVVQLLLITNPVSTVGQALDSLVEADRVLAATALAEATAANPTSSQITTANTEMSLAATAKAAGAPREAIQHYRKAWKASMKALGFL